MHKKQLRFIGWFLIFNAQSTSYKGFYPQCGLTQKNRDLLCWKCSTVKDSLFWVWSTGQNIAIHAPSTARNCAFYFFFLSAHSSFFLVTYIERDQSELWTESIPSTLCYRYTYLKVHPCQQGFKGFHATKQLIYMWLSWSYVFLSLGLLINRLDHKAFPAL